MPWDREAHEGLVAKHSEQREFPGREKRVVCWVGVNGAADFVMVMNQSHDMWLPDKLKKHEKGIYLARLIEHKSVRDTKV